MKSVSGDTCIYAMNLWFIYARCRCFFTAGLKRCLRGGLVGFGLGAAYCLYTSKDHLKRIVGIRDWKWLFRLSVISMCSLVVLSVPLLNDSVLPEQEWLDQFWNLQLTSFIILQYFSTLRLVYDTDGRIVIGNWWLKVETAEPEHYKFPVYFMCELQHWLWIVICWSFLLHMLLIEMCCAMFCCYSAVVSVFLLWWFTAMSCYRNCLYTKCLNIKWFAFLHFILNCQTIFSFSILTLLVKCQESTVKTLNYPAKVSIYRYLDKSE